MKPFLAHLRDEQQQRKAKAREQAIAASSENDPRADINVPYESPPEFKRMMATFGKTDSSEPNEEPIEDSKNNDDVVEPQTTEKQKDTGKKKLRGSRADTGKKKLRGSRAEGMSVQQLATRFGVSQPTVSIRLKSAFDKFRQDPELSKWAESRKPRKISSFDMPSIDATTPWSEVKDYSYMQHYNSHIQDHVRPHTGQTSPGRRKAIPSKPAAEETTRVLRQQNGEWTVAESTSTKTFRDIMVLLTEKMRQDPKQEKARLNARLQNVEKSIPSLSREEQRLIGANTSKLSPSELKKKKIVDRKVTRQEYLRGQRQRIMSAMENLKKQ